MARLRLAQVRKTSVAGRRLPLVEIPPATFGRAFMYKAKFREFVGEPRLIAAFHAGEHRRPALLDFRNKRGTNTLITVPRRNRGIRDVHGSAVLEAPFEIVPSHEQRSDNRFVLIDCNRRKSRCAAGHDFGEYVFLLSFAPQIGWNV